MDQFNRNCFGCGANFFDDYNDGGREVRRFVNVDEDDDKRRRENEARHVNLKRFIILPKIPCNRKKQLAIIEVNYISDVCLLGRNEFY